MGLPTPSTACPTGECTCRNLFPAACGSLNATTLYLRLDPDNLQYAATWLTAIGINDIQTFLGSIAVTTTLRSRAPVSWSIDIFPKLEVVTGGLAFYLSSAVTILPGTGLSCLRVTGSVTFGYLEDTGLQNTDLAFLSRLECPGEYIFRRGLTNLFSLKGLDRVVDGLAGTNVTTPGCAVYLPDNLGLTDVKALTRFARCGASPRPDAGFSRPCLQVTCGILVSWSQLCSYIARGGCA